MSRKVKWVFFLGTLCEDHLINTKVLTLVKYPLQKDQNTIINKSIKYIKVEWISQHLHYSLPNIEYDILIYDGCQLFRVWPMNLHYLTTTTTTTSFGEQLSYRITMEVSTHCMSDCNWFVLPYHISHRFATHGISLQIQFTCVISAMWYYTRTQFISKLLGWNLVHVIGPFVSESHLKQHHGQRRWANN